MLIQVDRKPHDQYAHNFCFSRNMFIYLHIRQLIMNLFSKYVIYLIPRSVVLGNLGVNFLLLVLLMRECSAGFK